MTSYEERKAMIETAQILGALIHEHSEKLRAMLREMIHREEQVVNLLITEADRLLPAAADEVEAGTSTTKKIVTYGTSVVVETGRRKCSLCRLPGHRAKNCPNAHTIREADKAAKDAKPPKRAKREVSPERRAQLAEQLKKARAARKGKS
jgi:hypothetical protein